MNATVDACGSGLRHPQPRLLRVEVFPSTVVLVQFLVSLVLCREHWYRNPVSFLTSTNLVRRLTQKPRFSDGTDL